MSALEFAVDQAFRCYFFGLRLIVGWLVVCAPLLVAVWYLVLRDGLPQPGDLAPVQAAALAVLAVAGLLASASVMVNWNRRVLREEAPRGLGWIRLDGAVWRYVFALLVIVILVAAVGGLAAFSAIKGAALLEPKLAGAAQPAARALAVILALLAVLIGLRLMSALPAISVANRDFGLGSAWRASRRNTLRYLGFLFWLLFTIGLVGGLAAGAVLLHQLLPTAWFLAIALAVDSLVGFWILFMLMSVPACLYACFGEGRDFAQSD